MKLIFFIFILTGFSHLALALSQSDREQILKMFSDEINTIQSDSDYKKFLQDKDAYFEKLTEAQPTRTVVEKREVKFHQESFTLAICYNQALIKAPLEKVKTLFIQPEKFQDLYDLSKKAIESKPEGENFQARIYKAITGFKDQDYTLKYESKSLGVIWCQRASLVVDSADFALRDNLKCLESIEGGTVYREVSYLYPLDWYVRAMGPTMRSRFQEEMNKVAKVLKCVAEGIESGSEYNSELTKSCWKK